MLLDTNSVYQIPVEVVAGKRSATVYPNQLNGPYEKYHVKL